MEETSFATVGSISQPINLTGSSSRSARVYNYAIGLLRSDIRIPANETDDPVTTE